jgi:hypothetical protein
MAGFEEVVSRKKVVSASRKVKFKKHRPNIFLTKKHKLDNSFTMTKDNVLPIKKALPDFLIHSSAVRGRSCYRMGPKSLVSGADPLHGRALHP